MLHQDFTAYLYCTSEGREGYVGVSATHEGSIFSSEEDGWLMIDRATREFRAKPVRFTFRYKEHTDDRVHYDIGCATPFRGIESGQLGFSTKGYAGFYGISKTHDLLNHISPLYWALAKLATVSFWKLETLTDWDGSAQDLEQVDVHIRDHKGRRLGAFRAAQGRDEFLNVESGEVLTFRLVEIRTH